MSDQACIEECFAEVFDAFDVDGDGCIDMDEYKNVLSTLSKGGVSNTPFMFSRIDSNQDGKVDLDEFLTGIMTAVRLLSWLDIENVLSVLQDNGISPRSPKPPEIPDLAQLRGEFDPTQARSYSLPDDLKDHYSLDRVLGKGAFGEVFLGRHKISDAKIAFKVVNFDKESEEFLKEMTMAEAKLMSRLDHRNVMKCISVSEKIEPHQVWLGLPFMNGGDLREAITEYKRFDETISRAMMLQIFDALHYLHDEVCIVHRDLKPLNVLLRHPISSATETPDLVLCDFGLSTEFKSTKVLKMLCGTPHYLAPEIVKSEGYTRSVDCWAAGVILYELHCGKQPFLGPTQELVFSEITEGQLDMTGEIWTSASESLHDLISSLLDRKPLRRCCVMEALAHPWMSGSRSSVTRERNVMELLADFGSDSEEDPEVELVKSKKKKKKKKKKKDDH